MVESKFGADCSLLVSPAKVNDGELLVLSAEEPLPDDEVRKSIQGTATCLPPAVALDDVEELIPVLLVLAPGVVLVLPASFPLNEMTANSNLPEFGLTMKSLMLPTDVPDEPITWAPVNWLPRRAS